MCEVPLSELIGKILKGVEVVKDANGDSILFHCSGGEQY
jgi:hypothetical protein